MSTIGWSLVFCVACLDVTLHRIFNLEMADAEKNGTGCIAVFALAAMVLCSVFGR